MRTRHLRAALSASSGKEAHCGIEHQCARIIRKYFTCAVARGDLRFERQYKGRPIETEVAHLLARNDYRKEEK